MPALVAGIHDFKNAKRKTWIPGTSPGMTVLGERFEMMKPVMIAEKFKPDSREPSPAMTRGKAGEGPAHGTLLASCHAGGRSLQGGKTEWNRQTQ
jgi:hypothetical protein